MFIYKITVNSKIYIGIDTHPKEKQKRWKEHLYNAFKKNKKNKLYNEMKLAGSENCHYEILEEGFSSIPELALTEIQYIKKYDSKNNGLNSTYGGDGMGRHLHCLTTYDIEDIKKSLSNNFKEYNNKRFKGKTKEEKRQMIIDRVGFDSLYNKSPEMNKKISESMKAHWNSLNDEKRKNRNKGLKDFWKKLSYDEKINLCKRENGYFTPKKYEITWDNGKKEIIENLVKFCKDNNISRCLLNYHLKKNQPHKGITKLERI